MLDRRIAARISFLSLLLSVDISFGAVKDTVCDDSRLDPGELIVQFRGATCTAQARGSCVGDRCFGDGIPEALPLGLFSGSAPGTRAPVIAYRRDAEPGLFYAVIMIDQDAPSPSNPTMSPWLHWMMVNILGEHLLFDEFEGDTKKVYAPPTPPSGVHKYKFILYRQPGYLRTVQTPTNRARFDVIAFERDYLLVPVSWASFKTGREVKG